MLITGIYGLNDWTRATADRLAAEGFIALAPDLLSGKGPGGGGYGALETRDDVVALMRELTPDEVDVQLDAVRAHGMGLPAASGADAVIGFCWGGGVSFRYADRTGLDASVVYYGTAPDAETLAALGAPVLGLYGGDDERVNATIEPADTELRRLGKSYDYEIYDGRRRIAALGMDDPGAHRRPAVGAVDIDPLAVPRRLVEGVERVRRIDGQRCGRRRRLGGLLFEVDINVDVDAGSAAARGGQDDRCEPDGNRGCARPVLLNLHRHHRPPPASTPGAAQTKLSAESCGPLPE